MSLERAIDELVDVLSEVSYIRSLKEAKGISKRTEVICKSFREVKEVNSSQARYILDRIKKIDAEPPFARKTTFREKILIQHELRNSRNLLFKKKYLGGIMDKNWEAFMDADAQLVCRDIELPLPSENDVLRFKIKLEGQPIPKGWDFTLEFSGEKLSNISLGRLEYEGVAKLSQSLLYIDWIHTSKKKSDFTLGPPFIHRPPKTIPLSIIAKVDAPSQLRTADIDFVVSTPTAIDETMKKEHRNYLNIHTPEELEIRSYHPLPTFLFRAKIERAKGERKYDQEIMKERVIERLKQNTPESSIDIGWKLGVLLSFYKSPEFPPINRGVLTPHGEEVSPQATAAHTPISEETYKHGVLDRFEEDRIYHSEETIGKIPAIWGATNYRVLGSSFIVHTPYGFGKQRHKTDDVNVFCVGVLGFSDHVDKDLFKEFVKNADKFAKHISPKNLRLVVFPVLMTNTLDSEAKKWAIKLRKGAIVELSRGKIHFMRESIWGTQSRNPFFMRYFFSEEMRSAEAQRRPVYRRI